MNEISLTCKCMLVLLKYDETSPVYYILNISIPKCHFPSKTSTVDSSRAPQRERPRRRDLERFLLFRLEIEKNWNKKITSEIPGKPARTGSLKVLSGKSWYECSQTGDIVTSIVWLSPQLDMFTILWGSHIVMDAYFPSVMIIRHGGSLYSE